MDRVLGPTDIEQEKLLAAPTANQPRFQDGFDGGIANSLIPVNVERTASYYGYSYPVSGDAIVVRHPGFGLFNKEHREFFDAFDSAGWQAIPGYSGVEEKILSGTFDRQARSGAVTRLSRWAAGAAVANPVAHDWCEEVLLISGTLSIGQPGNEKQILPAGTYAVRPAGVSHGPFLARTAV